MNYSNDLPVTDNYLNPILRASVTGRDGWQRQEVNEEEAGEEHQRH